MNIISIRELRSRCQSTDYGYDVYPLMFRFFRVISIYFTWLLIQTNLTPNSITLLGIVLGVFSGVAFIFDSPYLAVGFVYLAIIADFSDGEVSRFKQLTSKEGTYLDKVHHAMVHPFFIGGFVIWIERQFESSLILPFGMLSVLNSMMLPFVVMYALDVSLLKHLLRVIRSNNTFSINCAGQSSVIEEKRSASKEAGLSMLSFVQRICDFPYVIVIYSIFTIGFVYDSTLVSSDFLIALTVIYSTITSLLIVIYLTNVLFRKGVARRLESLGISHKPVIQ